MNDDDLYVHATNYQDLLSAQTTAQFTYESVKMPPKKKGNKKGNDDWETELGESMDPIAAATQDAKEAEVAQDAEEDGAANAGGGLLAALKKNKSKKQKKGKQVDEDYVASEDPPAANGANGHAAFDGIDDLAAKAPEEATTEDLFEVQTNKTKGGKGKQGQAKIKEEEEESAEEEGSTLKSKKEKEKEKKEREKQRKKEQVGSSCLCSVATKRVTDLFCYALGGRKEKDNNCPSTAAQGGTYETSTRSQAGTDIGG